MVTTTSSVLASWPDARAHNRRPLDLRMRADGFRRSAHSASAGAWSRLAGLPSEDRALEPGVARLPQSPRGRAIRGTANGDRGTPETPAPPRHDLRCRATRT